eukprot:11341526-Alexandrium_andersonii.AAC.1
MCIRDRGNSEPPLEFGASPWLTPRSCSQATAVLLQSTSQLRSAAANCSPVPSMPQQLQSSCSQA